METIDRSDLSHIKNIDDLHKEILAVKIRLRTTEQYIKEQRKELPDAVVRMTIGKVIPIFLKRGVVSNLFGVVKNAKNLFSSVKSNGSGSLKDGILSSVRKIGVVTALRAGYNLYKSKKKVNQ